MKIQIPPSSQILNCTHNITPGLKRKRGRKNENNRPSAVADRGSSALCFEFLSVIPPLCEPGRLRSEECQGVAGLWYAVVDNLLKQRQIGI